MVMAVVVDVMADEQTLEVEVILEDVEVVEVGVVVPLIVIIQHNLSGNRDLELIHLMIGRI